MENNIIFKRKIYQKLLEWKVRNTNSRKNALIVKGPRQVGKTTIVLEFAKKEYENYVYINFMNETRYKECFAKDLDVELIISELKFKNQDFKFIPGKTLIIFDEIQECANARSSLKPFCLDGRYDVIGTGSLLGVVGYNDRTGASIPVGFEEHLTLGSLDFEEFLLAEGYKEDHFQYLRDKLYSLTPISETIHQQMCELYKWYLLVGGMPEVVMTYLNTKDIREIRRVQKKIVDAYKSDFGKYLNVNEETTISKWDRARLGMLYESIPQQLARNQNIENNESTKFKFGDVKSGGRYRDFYLSLQWLKDAGLINISHNLTQIVSPLNAHVMDNSFRIYMNDTGLFMSHLEDNVIESIHHNHLGTYKGYIYENLISDQLVKNGMKLYFYDEYRESEIDFVVSTWEGILLIDVKANSGSTTSLKKELKKNNNLKGIKLSNNNIGLDNNLLTMPSYLAYLIDENFKFPGKK